ncbi:hypothetical protein PRIPAC_70060 [Pristionchus pacificus]|uniref:Uncharacterized protein n=1 Tax=Pristionchus pacificus TaxID=54126 RepID=A0A2A6CF04_PRIPA|nr:hypothetical protein PRIPAC_70060 [Pristionchus pacificus]|eukprot:PDM76825.1 hypothetical protein PRIPAC_42220 [Pristionchus pacificus]
MQVSYSVCCDSFLVICPFFLSHAFQRPTLVECSNICLFSYLMGTPERHPLALEDVWYAWVRPCTAHRAKPLAGPHFTARHWRFFGDVAEIRDRMGHDDAGVKMDVEDPMAPTVHFALRHDEYWLRAECPEEADQPPPLQGECGAPSSGYGPEVLIASSGPGSEIAIQIEQDRAFIAGFEYEWNERKRLADLVQEYHQYATRIDEAIGHIKEIDAHEIKLIGYDLAESGEGGGGGVEGSSQEEEGEEGGVCLRVRARVAGGVGEVRLCVAVDDPLAYPRSIRIVEREELMRELKADTWVPGESLVANLVDLFADMVAAGEVAEAYEKSAMEGGGKADEEWDAEWCGFAYPMLSSLAFLMSSAFTSQPAVVISRAPPPPAAAAAAAAPEVHSIPCKTSYTGAAPVGDYLMREKGEDGKERTAVRGRRLDGVRVELPEGYECRLLLQKGIGRLEPEPCTTSTTLTFWEHDREPSERSTLPRALGHLAVAAALAAPAAD